VPDPAGNQVAARRTGHSAVVVRHNPVLGRTVLPMPKCGTKAEDVWQKLIRQARENAQTKARAKRMKDLDGHLPTDEQKRLLCEMMYRAFLELRHLGWQGKAEQAADLADAFHNLPTVMYSPDFRWSVLHMFLESYQRKYPNGFEDYVAMLENITKAP
jgi:hypothetical protein